MQKKAKTLRSIHNCTHNKDVCYSAEAVSVCCDNYVHPSNRHETEYKSFRYKCTK